MDFIEILEKFDTKLENPFNQADLMLQLFSPSFLSKHTGISYPTISKMKQQGLSNVNTHQVLSLAECYSRIRKALLEHSVR